MIRQETVEQNDQYYPTANRNVKDRLFRFIFQNKEDLLDLYNAVNQSDYTNVDDLEINTIEESVYLSMKNDVSFLIGGTLNLYEHQSTYNPNMPMRGLIYLAKLYERYINSNEVNVYRSQLQRFPTPQYIVFYNGLQEEPDRIELKLSDAFENARNQEPCLECCATMLNINYGHNKALMERCRKLEEYSIFIAAIRRCKEFCNDFTEAVNLAIDECIKKDVLWEILTNSKSEVVSMVLTTFNQALYERDIRREGYEDGLVVGIKNFIEMSQKYELFTKEEIRSEIMKRFSVRQEEAENYMNEFWEQITNYRSGTEGSVLTTFNQEAYEKDLREKGYIIGAIQSCIETHQELSASKEATLKRIVEKFSLSIEDAEKYIEEFWK